MARLLLVLLVACSGGDSKVGGSADAAPCVPGAVVLDVTSPAQYACHEPFKAKLVVQNHSCQSVAIRNITVVGNVTSGTCGPAAPASYDPAVASVAAGGTATILDVTTGPFCCGAPGCPAAFACDETFDFTVATADAPLNGQASAHLDLGGCDTVCK
jgi:hypothetical protein